MNETFISRLDNFHFGKKRNVIFSLEVDSDSFYSLKQLRKLHKDLGYIISMEDEIKNKGAMQRADIPTDGIDIMCSRGIEKNKMQMEYIFVSCASGQFYLHSLSEAQAMCDMLDSIIKDEEGKR